MTFLDCLLLELHLADAIELCPKRVVLSTQLRELAVDHGMWEEEPEKGAGGAGGAGETPMDEAALTTALAAEEAAEAALAVETVLSESEDEAVITAAQHDANGCEGEGAPPGSTRAPRKRNPAPKRGGTPSRAPTDGAQDDASLADALGAMALASAEAPTTAPRPKGRKTATAGRTNGRASEAEAEPAVPSAFPVPVPKLSVPGGVINVHLLASDGRELQVMTSDDL